MNVNNNYNQYSPAFGAGYIRYKGDWTKGLQKAFENCPYIKNALDRNYIIIARNTMELSNEFDYHYNGELLSFIKFKIVGGFMDQFLNLFRRWIPIANEPHRTETLVERLNKGVILNSAIKKLGAKK